jgi:hypothetical protein
MKSIVALAIAAYWVATHGGDIVLNAAAHLHTLPL